MRATRELPAPVRATLAQIRNRALRQAPVDLARPTGQKRLRLDLLLAGAEAAILCAASARSRRDGYAAQTSGNGSVGGGGSWITVKRPADEGRLRQYLPEDPVERERLLRRLAAGDVVERIGASPVERAVLDGANMRTPEVDRIGKDLIRELGKLDAALAAIESLCGRWDRLRSTAELDDGPQCFVASVMHRLPWDHDWTPVVSTTFAGYLDPPWPEQRRVSRWVYDFTRKHHRVPTGDEMREYLARGTVRTRT